MAIKGTPGQEDVPAPRSTTSITPGEPKIPTQAGRPFSAYMEGTEPNPLLQTGKGPQVSPFDLAHGKVPAAGPNFNTIQEQAKMATTTMGDVTNQLKTPKLKLRQSSKYLLKNKLTSAKGHIKSASAMLGAPTVDEEEVPQGASPIAKYLALVTDGQNQLQAAQDQVKALSAKGENMRPADMLLVQIKLAKAQQELTYSSMLLSKAVDDLKMMMNIQL